MFYFLSQTPSTTEEWLTIANGFWIRWNFPNCIGALDGKHVIIKKPAKTGSAYYNYKGSFSIVLMALADASYKFTYVNIGAKGFASDGGVFNLCQFNEKLENNELELPADRVLPDRERETPFVIVADDAFALQTHIMKPYSKRSLSLTERVYNYRLSRARRIIENVFGIASARFRCLRRTFALAPEKVTTVVSAVCVLHNFCMSRSKTVYAPASYVDSEVNGVFRPGNWRQDSPEGLTPLAQTTNANAPTEAKEIMREFTEFFVTQVGQVPWQYKMCGIPNPN